MPIRYENTDLVLQSTIDLTPLAAAFKSGTARALHVTFEGGLWYSSLETDVQYKEPETNIAAMLSVVESLEAPLRSLWESCSMREFNIGYMYGSVPWSYNEGLSAELVRRMGMAGASLRVTLYPLKKSRE